ncbi:MAG: hypothetical protein R3190_17960, partial [Thermoanaerobaculia bacterium]|nr:hypothetical protein [Thermoanaerobaculia bacterium]
MSPSKIVAVAVAEMRSARRLVRTWIFSLLAIGLTFIAYLYYAGIHAFASRFSATIGATGPRFLMSAMGIYLLAIFLVGIIFLGFDVRARDQRERIVEVIESRPVSNLELLVGRWLGLTLVAWTPVLVVAVLVQGFGGLAHFFDWPLGDTVQPVSLVGFVFVDALTALVLWCATVILLAVTLRNRLLVTVVAFVLLGLQVWSLMRTPIYLLPAISALSGFGA